MSTPILEGKVAGTPVPFYPSHDYIGLTLRETSFGFPTGKAIIDIVKRLPTFVWGLSIYGLGEDQHLVEYLAKLKTAATLAKIDLAGGNETPDQITALLAAAAVRPFSRVVSSFRLSYQDRIFYLQLDDVDNRHICVPYYPDSAPEAIARSPVILNYLSLPVEPLFHGLTKIASKARVVNHPAMEPLVKGQKAF